MSEHYTKNVTAILEWCSMCNRKTVHRVDSGKRGPCQEHSIDGASSAQLKRWEEIARKAEQPELF